MLQDTKHAVSCYHCGEDCESTEITSQDKHFCCQGCKTVYEILNKVELCDYYTISQNPGVNQKTKVREGKFAFLDDEQIRQKLIHFSDAEQSHITFYLPQMHCSSCIWLLEHLGRMDPHIIRSQVNFLKKELSVVFDHRVLSLKKVAELLSSIGYEPHFSLQNMAGKSNVPYDKSRIIKIGITGFCFANIMLLSFPEYFASGQVEEKALQQLFSYLNLGLSLPVFFYGASEFFISAFKSIRQRFLNIDAPIALAVLITFVRSVYEISTHTGAGYLDSMSGIVFFMLVGRFFQNKTYDTLAFNRDYTSYFPLGITRLHEDGREEQIPVSGLKTGHRIKVHSQEIIPADGILFMGKGLIDYSFVSGEALPVEKGIGEIIYAGGKQMGGALELEVVKDVSQSYLTQLWNNDVFSRKQEERHTSYIHSLSRYFTIVLFSIAALSAAYWQWHDPSKVWNAVTAILIVACPCALLLSASFTNGNMLRVLQKYGFYARHAGVIEQIGKVDAIVFDKTGTITEQQQSGLLYEGRSMSREEMALVRSLSVQSAHPLSRALAQALPFAGPAPVRSFEEIRGEGLRGQISGREIRIGSARFTGATHSGPEQGSRVFINIDGELIGHYAITSHYRPGLGGVLQRLGSRYPLFLLSGDNAAEKSRLGAFFRGGTQFNQSPQDKLDQIRSLQEQGHTVMMVGDGLNDAGALRQSEVGIAVTDNTNNFSPACDVILDGGAVPILDRLLRYCRKNRLIINLSFVLSILYNIAGLYFATRGELQPVIAAILMPASSISIILFTTGMSSWFAAGIKQPLSPEPETDVNHTGG
jgi:Cu+-exporting ATPase